MENKSGRLSSGMEENSAKNQKPGGLLEPAYIHTSMSVTFSILS